jgi:hypothetical protein
MANVAKPDPIERRGFDARAGLLFAVAAVLLTWPLIVSPGESISIRDDYFQNLWNAWWLGTALFDLGVSPWWTDHLFHPTGVSLAHHTLSPVNALLIHAGSWLVSPATAYNGVLWLHFWLAGWAAYELARDQTGSRSGAALAGIVYAYAPVHFFYMPQINVATFEFLPLAILFLHRTWRDGGRGNAVGAVVCVALQAASGSYLLVYAILFALLILAFGRHFGPAPTAPSRRRLLAVGALCGVAVAIIAWPLLSTTITARLAGEAVVGDVLRPRGNDLLGFNWMIETSPIVSWPGVFGYSTLLLVAAGFRGLRHQKGWVGAAALFWVLSLGSELHVAGAQTGVPLPFAALTEVPVIGMLRMSNRFQIATQLALAVLCAAAWRDLAGRLRTPRHRVVAATATGAAIALELACVPLQMFQPECSGYYSTLAETHEVEALIELPVHVAPSFLDGRYNFCQTLHGKKIPQGYTTVLAVTPAHTRESRAWFRASRDAIAGNATALRERSQSQGIDRVVLNKRFPLRRPRSEEPPRVLWQPFFLLRHFLIGERQRGYVQDVPLPEPRLAEAIASLSNSFGEPVFEDNHVVVFATPDSR